MPTRNYQTNYLHHQTTPIEKYMKCKFMLEYKAEMPRALFIQTALCGTRKAMLGSKLRISIDFPRILRTQHLERYSQHWQICHAL